MTEAELSAPDQQVVEEHLQAASFVSSQPPRPFDRVMVTGLGRSGTSAISSLLRHCGYWLGEDSELNPALQENIAIQKLLNQRRYDGIYARLDGWARSHPRIAWKEPKLFLGKHRDFFKQLSEDWLIIVVLRDPMATSQRRIFVEGGTLVETLDHVVLNQKVLCRFLSECRNPLLVVSYEKLMQQPETSIGEIRRFLFQSDDDPSNRSIWDLMRADQHAYRNFALTQKAQEEGAQRPTDPRN